MRPRISDFLSLSDLARDGVFHARSGAVDWIHLTGNLLIGLAYIAIAASLGYLVWRGRDLPFKRVAIAFGAFIVGAGLTHVVDALVSWEPLFYIDAGLMLLTAAAALVTAFMLPRVVPEALALAKGARAARARGVALETMVHELGHMYEQARAADVTKTRLFANLSHELRTPLTLVLGPAERLLATANLGDEQRHDLEVVIRNARTLLKHVNDLLDVARIEAGKLELSYFESDVGELAARAVAHFRTIAREQQIDLRLSMPSELSAELDADKVERVLLNLLSNAFKVTPPCGWIHCELGVAEGDWLKLEVSDSGPGVPVSERERIFERFAQLDDSSTRRPGGTGLGLAIVREFVEAHRGSVAVEDAAGGGALFRVLLPRYAPPGTTVHRDNAGRSEETRAALDQTLAELEQRDAASTLALNPERPRVLVVEDNPEMNQFVRQTLSVEFSVSGAADGAAGLAAVVRERPDLLVTDVTMPGISGDELISTLRKQAEFSSLPVLVLTAKADETLRVRLLSEGAVDYLLKPFSASELLARARNLVVMKRARDILQKELDSQGRDVEVLAAELAQQKRELSSTLEAMRVARDQAEKASRVKSTFLRMVSHELRTPLAAIQLQLDRLARTAEELPAKPRELLMRCHSSTRRLARLVETVLEYTRIESGRIEVSRRPFNPVDVAAEVMAITQPHAEQKAVALNLHAPAELPQIESDPRLVRLVLLNLVENAVKFTDHGSVDVSVDVIGGNLKLSVHDSGPGIPDEQQPLVFEPFEQLGPTENKHLPGIGLGLALVREMVAALGGRVDLQSSPGEGACFTVSVPVRYVEAVA